MHQAAKAKAFQDGGNPCRRRVWSEIQEGAKLLKRIKTCYLPLFSLFLHIVHGLCFGFTFYTHYINIDPQNTEEIHKRNKIN